MHCSDNRKFLREGCQWHRRRFVVDLVLSVSRNGTHGTGNEQLGAPNLTDDVWLYGGSITRISESLRIGRNGIMPAQGEFLGDAKIHLLTAYIYSLSQQ